MPEARYFQLATVSREGRPDNRTLVFRGFSESGDALLAVTDTRSEKFGQLLANPAVCIAWYFAKSREQYRINGDVSILVDEVTDLGNADFRSNPSLKQEALSAFWSKLSEGTRQQFFWPHPRQPVEQTKSEDIRDLSAFFSVLCIRPAEVQYLDLKPSPQLREIHVREGDRWSVQVVNP
jgi:PPOX class probable FMN-dependent enzyme